jgi:hypothetical protein
MTQRKTMPDWRSCPRCYSVRPVRKDGRLYKHRRPVHSLRGAWYDEPCPASGRTPEEARIDMRAELQARMQASAVRRDP